MLTCYIAFGDVNGRQLGETNSHVEPERLITSFTNFLTSIGESADGVRDAVLQQWSAIDSGDTDYVQVGDYIADIHC